MAEQKYTLMLLLVGCFIAFATAQCSEQQVEDCRTDNNLGIYDYPALLEVPLAGRATLCANIQNYTTCLDEIPREDCSFARTKDYEPYESMAEFICGDLNAYDTHYTVISNDTIRDAWDDCLDGFNSLNEDSTDGCDVLNALVLCHTTEVTGESDAAQTYIEAFVISAYEYYDTHYLCPSGSSTVGITSSLMLMSLLAYLWSTFH